MFNFDKLSFRKQLVLWFAGSLIGIWLIFITIFGLIFKRTIYQQIDHHLHIVILQAKRIWQESNQLERAKDIQSLVSSQGMIVMVLASDGSSLLQTTSPDVTLLTQHQLQNIMAQQDKINETEPYHFTDFDMRFVTLPIQFESNYGLIAVGYSLKLLTNTMTNLIITMLILTVIIIFFLFFIGNWIINKALNPITNIIETANTIQTSKDLSARIPVRKVNDELEQLSNTLNKMLDRLQLVFKRQKQFFTDAAHTLKTPLTSIRLQTELLQQKYKDKNIQEKTAQVINIIDKNSKTISDLILLGKQSIKTNDKKINISKILNELVELTNPIIKQKGISTKTKILPNIFIKGDAQLIKKAILSVWENAILYSPEGKSIKLITTNSDQNIIIKIIDQGPGIKPTEQAKIWQRFYRGQAGLNIGSGSGLGLAIAKKIVGIHHGRITLHSQSGKGCKFTISLPICQN